MIIDVEAVTLVVTKRAETDPESEQLLREAAALDRARHPGVPELLAVHTEPVLLRLGPAPGRVISELRVLNDRQVAGLGAAVATTLADLHDIGVAHGAVTADHIVVDPAGQPMLTGFGSGPAQPDPSDDVAGLAAVLRAALPPDSGNREGRALRRVLAKAAHTSARRRPSARRLAALLVDRVRGATVSGTGNQRPSWPGCDDTDSPGPARPGTRPFLAVAAVAAAGLILIISLVWLRPPHRPAGVIATSTGRYRIGLPTDQVVTGRWRCREALAALLRPATGEVWVFDAWASRDHPETGRLVARVNGAIGLQVDPAGGSTGCDRLLITQQTGPPVGIDPNRAD